MTRKVTSRGINTLSDVAFDAQKPMAHVAMLSDTGIHWHIMNNVFISN